MGGSLPIGGMTRSHIGDKQFPIGRFLEGFWSSESTTDGAQLPTRIQSPQRGDPQIYQTPGTKCLDGSVGIW